MMEYQEEDDSYGDLIRIIDAIGTDGLKQKGYHKYVDRIVKTARRSLELDGSNIIILIQYIKSYAEPCFQRDVLIEVLHKLLNSEDLSKLMVKPFPIGKRDSWDSLATSITAIPDLIANCKCLSRYPSLSQQAFYKQLVDRIFEAIEFHSLSPDTTQDEYKFFLLKVIGRIAISGHKMLIWENLTQRVISEPRDVIKEFYFKLIRMVSSSQNNHMPFGLYMENLYLPIFLELKPSSVSGQIIKSALSDSVLTCEQLRYIICDKSIFKTNYQLPREKQAILLFNMAAYLSSLVTTSLHIEEDRCDNEARAGANSPSLLVLTLLEIVRSWTSSTKILIRTYQHSKFIMCALLIFLRHAIQYDKESIIVYANEIQSMLARAIPTYLNRATQEERNLATCLSELVLPKLHYLATICKRQISKDGENNETTTTELKLDFNVDLEDDLLYLKQLFQQDVEVIFQDLPDTTTTKSSQPPTQLINSLEIACSKPSDNSFESSTTYPVAMKAAANNDNVMSTRQVNENDKQLRAGGGGGGGGERGTRVPAISHNLSVKKNAIVVELDDRKQCEAKVYDCDDDDDDDLKPYKNDEDEYKSELLMQNNSDDDDDDVDEFELGDDATNVPIYLRDCINGLLENNNRLYVRLCLIRAGVLLDDLIEQDETETQKRALEFLASTTRTNERAASISSSYGYGYGSAHRRQDDSIGSSHKSSCVNDTLRDVGVELARTLLFLENQFSIDKFNEYRISCLISLCYAAPDLIGRYLIEEFNGHSRSMQQQLDILLILVTSALWLSRSARDKSALGVPKLSEASSSGVKSDGAKRVNRFAPYASMYFYGIVYRLKADFTDAGTLIFAQPKSILSAFRQTTNEEEDHGGGESGTATSEAEIMIRKVISQDDRHKHKQKQLPGKVSSSSRDLDDEEDLLEANSLSDDSFLLSRLLIAIANILSCSANQVVTCKFSTDLLDILSAYRCHPDSGVQRAIVNCLRMIRDCTPSTYYKEYIEQRMMRLFGPWLAENEAKM